MVGGGGEGGWGWDGMGWDGEVKGGWVSEAVTRDFKIILR